MELIFLIITKTNGIIQLVFLDTSRDLADLKLYHEHKPNKGIELVLFEVNFTWVCKPLDWAIFFMKLTHLRSIKGFHLII